VILQNFKSGKGIGDVGQLQRRGNVQESQSSKIPCEEGSNGRPQLTTTFQHPSGVHFLHGMDVKRRITKTNATK
jgi:hypothetical protein